MYNNNCKEEINMETEYKIRHVKHCYEIHLDNKFIASAETKEEAKRIIEDLEKEDKERGR